MVCSPHRFQLAGIAYSGATTSYRDTPANQPTYLVSLLSQSTPQLGYQSQDITFITQNQFLYEQRKVDPASYSKPLYQQQRNYVPIYSGQNLQSPIPNLQSQTKIRDYSPFIPSLDTLLHHTLRKNRQFQPEINSARHTTPNPIKQPIVLTQFQAHEPYKSPFEYQPVPRVTKVNSNLELFTSISPTIPISNRNDQSESMSLQDKIREEMQKIDQEVLNHV